jgi:hypothetical protein
MPSTGVWALMCSGPWPKAVGPAENVDERLGGMTVTDAGHYQQPAPDVDLNPPRSHKEAAAAERVGVAGRLFNRLGSHHGD